jgi:predicted transcriptional regulator
MLKDTINHLERNEYLELEILNRVEKTPQLSHRMLAAQLGCNLRLTHALLKKLVNHGLLEVRKLNSRRWTYFLTPSGLSSKASRTYRFFEFSMQFYQDARQRSSEICRELSRNGHHTVAFLGCGNLAEIVYLGVTEWNLELVEVYGKGKKEFLGKPVLPYDKLSESRADILLDCTFNPNTKNAADKVATVPECRKLIRIFP